MKLLRRSPTGTLGLFICVAVTLIGLLAPIVAPRDPSQADIGRRLRPPAWTEKGENLLGTDQQGRDVLSRIIYGSRVSLLVAFSAVVISGTIGTVLGLIAGYAGGWADSIIMRLADLQLSLPFILIAIAVMAVLGPGLWNVILVIGLTGWVHYARLVRAECMVLKHREFIESARAMGATHWRIMLRHILPNVAPTLIIWASVRLGSVIVLEATLTFLGLGVEATVPTWGRMLSDGRGYFQTHWWLTLFPGLAIMFTVLGANLMGDWLRDALDPKLRRQGNATVTRQPAKTPIG